jgi:glycosyltransferase involved in cell wall biosynthesis
MAAIHISVITSLYRCASFLQQFLEHYARVENIDECELILVHNDATEEELEILNRYRKPTMHILHILVKREGLYASWNRGIMASSGQYLAIWNVDDVRTPGSLAAQKAALEKSNAAMCYGDFYGTRTYGPFAEKLYSYDEYETGEKEAFKRHIIGCFPMWRKTIHQQIGYFDEQFKLVSDYEFQLRLIRRFTMVKAATVLGYYLEYAGHKLSSNRAIQHRERTTVELRYRMYDKIMLHVLPFISAYKVNAVLNFGRWTAVSVFIPGRRAKKAGGVLSLISMPFFYSGWFIKRSVHRLYTIIFQ